MVQDNRKNKRTKLKPVLVSVPQRIQDILAVEFAMIPGDSFQDKLDYLASCNCCAKHQINRPTMFAPWIETPFTGTQDTNCNCCCRHMARQICRQCV